MKSKKTKLTNLLKTVILFLGISLLLWNCEKDEDVHKHQEHQVTEIKYLDIKQVPEVASAISELNNFSSKQNKNIASKSMSTDFGSLNLTNVLEYANNDGKLTYSFLIDKEISLDNPYTFENLHLVKLEEGYLAYILKWESNEQWLKKNEYVFSLKTFTGKRSHYDLDYNLIAQTEFVNGEVVDNDGNKTSSRNQKFKRDVEITCVDVISSNCNGIPYDCGGSICGFGSTTFCSLSGGGGSGGGGDSTPTGGNGTRLPRGSGSSSSFTGNGSATTVPVIPSPLDIAISSFFNSLTNQEKDFLNNRSLLKEEIRNFLVKNYSLASVEEGEEENDTFDFVREAIGAEMEGAEVDWEEQIIISSTVPNCVKTIINKLAQNDAYIDLGDMPDFVKEELNLSGQIMDVFNNSSKYHLNFKVRSLQPNSLGQEKNAETKFNISTKGFDITLNSSYVSNATDLSIARTVIHESLHAYISLIYHTQVFSDLRKSLDKLLSQNGNNPNIAEHKLMVKNFISSIANSLESWDSSSLTDNNYYTYLSWSGGMIGTPAFDALSTAFQQNIIDANENEGQAGSGNLANSNALGNKNCN